MAAVAVDSVLVVNMAAVAVDSVLVVNMAAVAVDSALEVNIAAVLVLVDVANLASVTEFCAYPIAKTRQNTNSYQ
ncbi:hypothetical protein A8709_07660 [Paenibacillus pectinilyticus]|uniref:Uncharacterized protein n=1 Tax=Paenibacillus pectinilyticus TaxID=512399 RepID=A0A1C0ZTY0_9BACL|nr:hypothetical protein A8709_07660 [Paenibacillus pectinilyticus]